MIGTHRRSTQHAAGLGHRVNEQGWCPASWEAELFKAFTFFFSFFVICSGSWDVKYQILWEGLMIGYRDHSQIIFSIVWGHLVRWREGDAAEGGDRAVVPDLLGAVARLSSPTNAATPGFLIACQGIKYRGPTGQCWCFENNLCSFA